MKQPFIGITTSYSDGKQQIDHFYIQAIEQSGGIPVIVPMLEHVEHARTFAQLLDGLVVSGGPGITRGLIGTLPPDLPPVDVIRDRSDCFIYGAMNERPILGICYGMQFINAVHGGTIYADLTEQVQSVNPHSPQRGAEPHEITIKPESRLARVLNSQRATVNTYHIQAIASLGEGLIENARSDDGIIEGFESPDGRLLGLQFHPERMYDVMAPMFEDFVRRCGE